MNLFGFDPILPPRVTSGGTFLPNRGCVFLTTLSRVVCVCLLTGVSIYPPMILLAALTSCQGDPWVNSAAPSFASDARLSAHL